MQRMQHTSIIFSISLIYQRLPGPLHDSALNNSAIYSYTDLNDIKMKIKILLGFPKCHH